MCNTFPYKSTIQLSMWYLLKILFFKIIELSCQIFYLIKFYLNIYIYTHEHINISYYYTHNIYNCCTISILDKKLYITWLTWIRSHPLVILSLLFYRVIKIGIFNLNDHDIPFIFESTLGIFPVSVKVYNSFISGLGWFSSL